MIQLNSPTRATAEELTPEEEKKAVNFLNIVIKESGASRLAYKEIQRLIDNYQSYQHHKDTTTGLWAKDEQGESFQIEFKK